ncbi:hypothetical protein BDV95DRAFT_678929 [Massariosphaeria phaeospora]|uniref:Carrier domain-containing protein n=1 Tax=Massariosphaeria phaeospora TaxID=100035 RepID=A0A7C8M652_9PLEO|nr:hypothetical protein BDV95DRAFT_678929 [Massariosphaeria phaeospora]
MPIVPQQAPISVHLQELLKKTASRRDQGLILYSPGNVTEPTRVSYRGLYALAKEKSSIVQSIEGFKPGAPILLHLDTHWDVILWFWATLFANGVPVPSSPFSNVEDHRRKHIQGLGTLLESPICITTTKALGLFDCEHSFNLVTIEDLDSAKKPVILPNTQTKNRDDTAMLMLTSGSTGNAKAAQLGHKQVLAAVAGKNQVRNLPPDKPFLNWIGMDHVAALTEIHLHALYHGVDQVHVHATDMICSPRLFFDIISRHQVSRTFAPNFFLAKLVTVLDAEKNALDSEDWDFTSLKFLVSGGEANDIDTCAAVTSFLTKHGAPANVLATGFGMTETCAGAIYNTNCPDYDVRHNHTFASLGKCIKGIQMRVTHGANGDNVSPNEPGDLEVRGAVIFQRYYRNEDATREAFTPDGWFRTGDKAMIDSEGNLNLMGRAKDTMNINGVKVNPSDIQTSLDQALGSRVSRVVCFPSRADSAHTEQVTVAYIPADWPPSTEELGDINDTILKTSLLVAGARPCVYALADDSLLPKTTLGKISRVKMRSLFENGIFRDQIEFHHEAIEKYRLQSLQLDASDTEKEFLQDFEDILGLQLSTIGVDTPIFDMGVTSIDLIRLKRRIDTRLSLDVPIVTLMNNPTARSMAAALADMKNTTAYNPVVTLRHSGSKTPLWLVHPGVGEVLVFLGLSKHINDRPVYALRARGFDGEPYFTDIADTVETYRAAIKQQQPCGPYAIAGYSYGTMLAFEIGKVLESTGDQVRFMGSFNLPPHIKFRMRQLTWNPCLLHLAYFLGLVSEEYADSMAAAFNALPRHDALAQVLDAADQPRMAELGLDEPRLANWADLAYAMQSMAVDYEPSGAVATMDVFHAMPLKVAARNRDDWVQNHLSRWGDFCREEPRLHQVDGAHYTMIGADHVVGFSRTLEAALEARGL